MLSKAGAAVEIWTKDEGRLLLIELDGGGFAVSTEAAEWEPEAVRAAIHEG